MNWTVSISGNRRWQAALYIAILGMAGCWLYALLHLINELAVDSSLHVTGILLFLPVSFALNKVIRMLRWRYLLNYVVTVLMWLIFMLLAVKIELFPDIAWLDSSWLAAIPASIPAVLREFRPELLILISSAVLWWMGWRYANTRADFAFTFRELQFGLVLLLIALFSAHAKGLDSGAFLAVIFVFSGLSLLSVSIAHGQEGTGWLSGIQRRHWTGLLLIAIVVILILGLAIGSIVTPDLIQMIVDAAKWVWNLITKALQFILSLLPEPKSTTDLPPPPPQPNPELERETHLIKLPETVRQIFNIAYIVLVIGFVLLALWRLSSQLMQWLGRRLASMAGVEAEPIRGAFREDLVNFFALIKKALYRLLLFLFSFLRMQRRSEVLPEVASVRQVYRQLLRWAAAGGFPRGLSQTPNDYCHTLVELLPEAHVDLQLITHYYVSTRYGNFVPGDNEMSQMKQSWYRVQQNRFKTVPARDKPEQEGNVHE
jgi:hypothetical protein